jgi:hypothetical protein
MCPDEIGVAPEVAQRGLATPPSQFTTASSSLLVMRDELSEVSVSRVRIGSSDGRERHDEQGPSTLPAVPEFG